MKAYLEKSKSMNVKSFSPLSKMDRNIESVLEWIDEEDSNDDKNSRGYSVDPRMYDNNQYSKYFSKSSTMKKTKSKYSILTTKFSNTEFLQKPLKKLNRTRSTMTQPKKLFLGMDYKNQGK